MENGFMNKIIGLVLVLVIGATLVGGLLVPTVQAVTATETTFENKGYYSMDELNSDTERTIVWQRSNPKVLTIDGETLDMSFAEINKSYTLIGSENLIVRYQTGANNFAGIQAYSSTVYASFHTDSAADAGDTVTLTVSNDALTYVTNGTSPLSRTFNGLGNDGYIINPTGTGEYSFVMKKADTSAYVLGDSEIKFLGVSLAGGPEAIALYGSGTIATGMELTTIYKPAAVESVSYSEPVPTDSAVSGFENLYSLDKYEFTITYDSNTYDATYSYFVVPASITAQHSFKMDASQIAIFGVVGLLGIVLLVTIAASAVRSKY